MTKFSVTLVPCGSYMVPQVNMDSKFVAQFPMNKYEAATRFAEYCERNNIDSMEEWLGQPGKVKHEFVMTSGQVSPHFPK